VPDVIAALERMGKTLNANAFSFSARTIRAYPGPNGELLHIEHVIKTTVRRPDRMIVDVNGDDGVTKLFYDGINAAILGHDQKHYAMISVPDTIGGMMDTLSDRLQVDFPLADLLLENAQSALLGDIVSGGQVGTATIGGVQCRHFFFNQMPDQEVELWLEDNDQALPRRVIVTYRSLFGRPRFIESMR
jgi:hypothetical protein